MGDEWNWLRITSSCESNGIAASRFCYPNVNSVKIRLLLINFYITKLHQLLEPQLNFLSLFKCGVLAIYIYCSTICTRIIVTCYCTVGRHEIKVVTSASYLRGLYLSTMVFSERTSLFITLLSYSLMGHHISADKVIDSYSLLSIMLRYGNRQLYRICNVYNGVSLHKNIPEKTK
jgi:hypothetical protein